MKKITVFLILISLFAVMLSGCACEHEWVEATCTDAKYCPLCEEVEGEPLGHTWADATCTEPKTCSACNLTEGEALGHTAGDAQLVSTDVLSLSSEYVTNCTVCGEELSTETRELTQLHDGAYYNFTVNEYIERLNGIMDEYCYLYAFAYVNENMDDDVSCDMISLEEGNDYYSYSFFYDGDIAMKDTQSDEAGIFNEVWTILDCSNENFTDPAVNILMIMMALDPELDLDTATTLTEPLTSIGGVTHNGITYSLSEYDEISMLFTAIVSK